MGWRVFPAFCDVHVPGSRRKRLVHLLERCVAALEKRGVHLRVAVGTGGFLAVGPDGNTLGGDFAGRTGAPPRWARSLYLPGKRADPRAGARRGQQRPDLGGHRGRVGVSSNERSLRSRAAARGESG